MPRGAYFPWGTGPHRCVGEHLAETTMTVALGSRNQRGSTICPSSGSEA
ncbi:cytochrome P450 [Streptomyces sp. NPDC003379]